MDFGKICPNAATTIKSGFTLFNGSLQCLPHSNDWVEVHQYRAPMPDIFTGGGVKTFLRPTGRSG